MIDQLLLDLDRNRVSGLIFVDYKKAFDLVDHKILLAKLEAYGIETRDLDLIRTYLTNRLLILMAVSHPFYQLHTAYHKELFGTIIILNFR